MSSWTEAEIILLENFYPNSGSRVCAGKLRHSRKAIRNKASLLGIRTKLKNGHPVREVTKLLSDNRCIAVCPEHGETEHYFYSARAPICVECTRLRDADRDYKTAHRRQIVRAAARRRRATLLGKYENRLRVSLASYLNGKASFSRHLSYSAEELYDYLEAIRERQRDSCPMCGASYEDVGFNIDHIVPLSSAKTGRKLLGLFDLSNLSLLCPHCNQHVKRDRMPV